MIDEERNKASMDLLEKMGKFVDQQLLEESKRIDAEKSWQSRQTKQVEEEDE